LEEEEEQSRGCTNKPIGLTRAEKGRKGRTIEASKLTTPSTAEDRTQKTGEVDSWRD
jgi:hypothetical protein